MFTEINESSVICPQHRDNQGIHWRPHVRCLSAVENRKISDVVLEEFKQDLPSVNMLFCKSDNANCYHINFAAEGLYHLCKQHGIQLLRHDYNEPSKGKDQCDRDSATVKALLRNYVDAVNDLANANDIYSGLHYALSVTNAKVAVIDIDQKIRKVAAQEIPFTTQYHSFKFQEDTIKIQRYFDIGEGVEVPCFDSIEVISGAVIKKISV